VPDSPDTDFLKMKNKWDLTSDYFTYQIDINDVIEEITFDPYFLHKKSRSRETWPA
jgi:hypothetical protein